MADRSIAAGDTLRKLFIEFNATAEDIGDISDITGASGIIASATDVVEAVTALNTDLTTISTDNHIFSGGSIAKWAKGSSSLIFVSSLISCSVGGTNKKFLIK